LDTSSGNACSTITGSGFNIIFKIIGVGMLDDDDDDDDVSALCCHPCFGCNTFREDAMNTAGSCLAFFGCSSAALP
jgi:hypothetical protein